MDRDLQADGTIHGSPVKLECSNDLFSSPSHQAHPYVLPNFGASAPALGASSLMQLLAHQRLEPISQTHQAVFTSSEMSSNPSSSSYSMVDEYYSTRSSINQSPNVVSSPNLGFNGASSTLLRPDGGESGARGQSSPFLTSRVPDVHVNGRVTGTGHQFQLQQPPHQIRLQPAPPGRNAHQSNATLYMMPASSPTLYPHQQPLAAAYANASPGPSRDPNSSDTHVRSSRKKQLVPASTLPTVRSVKSMQQHRQHSASVGAVSSLSSSPTTSTATYPHLSKLPRREWSRDDIDSLLSVLNEVDGRSWTDISKRAFSNDKFAAGECQEKWRELSKEKKEVNRGPWTQEEDQALLDAVGRLRPEKWVVIATQVGARNGKQCRERWFNHLSPDIKKSTFSAEEDEIIFHWYSLVGSKWSEIAKHLPGRPDNMIKNHFNTAVQRQKRRLRHIQTDQPKDTASDKDRQVKEASQEGEDEPPASPAKEEDPVADTVKRTRPASASVSSTVNAFEPQNSTSAEMDSFPASSPMTGLGLGLLHPSSQGMTNSVPLSPGATSQYTSSTSSAYPTYYSDRYVSSPAASVHSPISANMMTSPTMPSRYGTGQARFLYHPYSRATTAGHINSYREKQQQQQQPYRAGQQPMSSRIAPPLPLDCVTPPTTPEAGVSTGYAVYDAGDSTQTSAHSAAVPFSAPPSREYFSMPPSTPARRATVAIPTSYKPLGRLEYYDQSQLSPVTATSYALTSMSFGQKSFTLPLDPPPAQQRQEPEQQLTYPPPRPTGAYGAMHLSTLTSESTDYSPYLRHALISPRPSNTVNPGQLEDVAAAYEASSDASSRQASADGASYQDMQQEAQANEHTYDTPPLAADRFYDARNNSISSSAGGSLISPCSSFQSPTSYAYYRGAPNSASSTGTLATSIASPTSAQMLERKLSFQSSWPHTESSSQQGSPYHNISSFSPIKERGYPQGYASYDGTHAGVFRSRASSDAQHHISENFAAPYPPQGLYGHQTISMTGRDATSAQTIQEEEQS